MKYLLFAVASLFAALNTGAQVAVSTDGSLPHASAMLEVKTTNRGFLLPRLTSTQRNAIASPATGLLVYETTSNAIWVYNGSAWVQLGAGGGSSDWLASGNHLYNGNSGNVGIGLNTNINEKLTIKGNALITYVNGNDLTNGGALARLRLMGANTGSSSINFLKLDSSEGAIIYYANALQDLIIRNDGVANQMVLKNNGRIGMGTSTPDERLDIAGNLKLTGGSPSLRLETAQGGSGSPISSTRYASGLQFYRQGTSTLLGKMEYVDTLNASNFLRFYVGSSVANTLTVTGDNAVGIGTQNPQVKMHVVGAGEILRLHSVTDPLMQFTTGLAASGIKKAFLDVDGNDFRVGTNSGNDNGNLIFRVNGLNTVYVTPSGNVNIGTSTSANGYKVSVAGKVICEEVRVQLRSAWPDYVFSGNYQLMDLRELEQFILANKHLPNILPAAQIEKEGIALGDMQKKLMEKIEELTLYIIQQQKEIDALKVSIQENRNR